MPSVAAVILNSDNEFLLQEKENEAWSLPAGMIEPGDYRKK
ncbi:MAG: NUDIX domain-containing protein [Leptolyngbyaceae cyanobacterium]